MKEKDTLPINRSKNEEEVTTKRGRMNNTPLPACPKIVKWVFIFFNLIFAVLGILLIALGSWLVTTGHQFLQEIAADDAGGSLSDLPILFTATTLGGAGLIIFCGLVTFILAALGVLGGICQARPLLVIFALGLVLIVLIEFIGAVVVIVAITQRPAAIDSIANEMRAALNGYRDSSDPPVNEAGNAFVDAMQRSFDCCGIQSPDDWNGTRFVNNTGFFPNTCCTGAITNCTRTDTEFHTNGCIPAIETLLVTNRIATVVVSVIAFLFLLVEISGIVIAFGLCCCIRSAKLTLV